MIKAHDAIRTARCLLGTPYSQMDCIALIRAVIKRTAGGVSDYRCEGTNWLWRSIENSSKYRHLTERWESIEGARGGMLAFKRSGDDIHHVGLVTEKGTVIHSSSVHGCVVETELDGSWDLLGKHKHIAVLDVPVIALTEDLPESHDPVGEPGPKGMTRLIRNDGTVIELVGDWRSAED